MASTNRRPPPWRFRPPYVKLECPPDGSILDKDESFSPVICTNLSAISSGRIVHRGFDGGWVMRGFGWTLAIVGVVLIPILGGAADSYLAQCRGVVDGDTLEIEMDGQTITTHLDAIDAPHLLQERGAEAKAFLEEIALNQDVVVERLTTMENGDWRGRVTVGDRDLSLAMLEAGLAWHDIIHNSNEDLVLAEILARSARRGLWADVEPEPPWEWKPPEDYSELESVVRPRRLSDVAGDFDLKKGEDGRTIITQPTPGPGSKTKGKKGPDGGDSRFCCCEVSRLDSNTAKTADDAVIEYKIISRDTCENAVMSMNTQTGYSETYGGCVASVHCGEVELP